MLFHFGKTGNRGTRWVPVCLIIFGGFAVTVCLLWAWVLADISGDVATAVRHKARALQISSQIRDYRGQDIGVFSDEVRHVVPLKQIPRKVQASFLAAEDDGFWRHIGISPRGLLRALMANIKHDRFAQGGSTITQQLVRQLLLDRKKTVARKIREVTLAITLERQMKKSEILEIWLNSVYLGNKSWGVEAASRRYFNKHVNQLTLEEAAMLAGLPQAPSKYAPHLNPKLARKRQLYVLKRMNALRWISLDDFKVARSKKTKVEARRDVVIDHAPWVTEMARIELWRRLEQKDLPSSGLIVNTTVDRRWQQSLQRLVAEHFSDIHKSGLEVSIVVLDSRSGEIRAIIGGSDFRRNQFNRAVDIYRPLGAAIYPLIFGWGIEKGILTVDGYSSLGEAAVKSRFAEAEQIAPEIGYGLVRENLTGLGFVVKDAMAIDEMNASPLGLARSYLGVSGSNVTSSMASGIISSVVANGETIYQRPLPHPAQLPARTLNLAWVLRQWLSLGAGVDSKLLADQPLLKSIKGWNAWWIMPRTDVVIAAWTGAEKREPQNPRVLKDADLAMDQLLSKWIYQTLPAQGSASPPPEGISYQLYPGSYGRSTMRIPFVVSDTGVF